MEKEVVVTDYLPSVIPAFVYRIQFRDSYNVFLYTSAQTLYRMLLFSSMHYNGQAKLLIDVTAADFPHLFYRHWLVYVVSSIVYNIRYSVSITVKEKSIVSSITSLFQASNWLEREIWDLFGISFTGHTDLRRMLTDYGTSGHPLRKDYPLSGFVESSYNEYSKCICNSPVFLIQDLRVSVYEPAWLFNASPIM